MEAVAEKTGPRLFEFDLPVGYLDEDGRLHRTALMRKMTGHEEALLGDRKLRQNAGRLVSELLGNCVKQLGELKPVTPQVTQQLTSADRNYLLVELRKITFGAELEASYVCPACSESTRMTHDLDELPVRRVEAGGATEIVVELDDGYEDRNGEVYRSIVFRLPTGVDEERVATTSRENPSRGMTALLTRCVTGLGDMPVERLQALGTKVLNDLTMSDRQRIDAAFRGHMPGVDMTADVDCSSCGRSFSTTVDLTGFFTAAAPTRRPYAARSSS